MWTWTRIFGLFFLVTLAVYSDRGNPAGAATVADIDAPTTAPKLPPDVNANLAATAAELSNRAGVKPDKPSQGLGPAQVNVSDGGLVEIHVNDANVLEVLRMISVQSQKNIVASKQVSGTVSANLYQVTIHEALDAILRANGFAYIEKGNFIYVYSDKELADMQKVERVMQTEIFRLYYIPVADVLSMIKPVLSADGQMAATKDAGKGIDSSGGSSASSGGGSSGSTDTGGNSYAGDDLLVITDYPENLDRARKLIKEIDRRPQQVLVEATILAATLSDNNAMGIDFSFLGGVDFNTLLGSGTSLGTALSSNVLNTVPSTAAPITTHGYAGGTTGNFDAQVPAGGLQIGIVHHNLGMFISALEAVTNTTILANPKVLALDKQSAQVHVGSSFGYQTTTVTQTTSTQSVQFFDTGTTLSFRPYVGDDGFIRMEIHPEDSSGGLNAANLPFKTTTEVSSNVMVRDGNTIVIGGLFREQSQTGRSQVPGLGSIPLLGALFRQQQDTTNRQEIIIMLTPHIIKDNSAYADVSQEELRKSEEYRVGVRKGMMFFARERLAETAYENAQHELNQPQPDRGLAMWHLNVATNLNPTFIEAIELKEKVSGRQVTDVDNSTLRGFVARHVLADRASASNAPVPSTQPNTH